MNQASDQVRAHLYISGLVQGVGFRYYTRQQAQQHGVSGWVRNLPDDRVEAVLEGDRSAVEQMVEWCRQGPPSAQVEGVQVTWEDPIGERSFDVRH